MLKDFFDLFGRMGQIVFFLQKVKLFTLIIVFFPFWASSQMLVNDYGQVLEDNPFFNSEFIKKHQIKSFRGSYATKFDHDVIRPNDDQFVYEFDRLGQLVRKYKVLMGDTLLSTYIYDYRGNVIIHRETNKTGYYERRYRYDDRNRLAKMELRRDYQNTQNKLSFELDEKQTVAQESYKYIPLEGVDYKRLCYNSSGRIFRVEFYYHNKKGQLVKKESALHNGTGRKEVNYFYTAEGEIEEVKTISKGTRTHSNKKLFTYDEKGNVLSRKTYRNGSLLKEEQLVYFEDTHWLKAIISRAEEKKLIILQFKNYRRY